MARFTLTVNVGDYTDAPIAGALVYALPLTESYPDATAGRIHVGTVAEVTDEAGVATLDLVSLPGLQYRIEGAGIRPAVIPGDWPDGATRNLASLVDVVASPIAPTDATQLRAEVLGIIESGVMDGADAPLPEFTATATTVAPGSPAAVRLAGVYPDLELELDLPRGADAPLPNITATATGAAAGTAPAAQVTGAYPNLTLALTIPKGDPGGWVNTSTVGNTVDLNTLTASGLYYNGSGLGTAALNYPVDGWAGYIEVITSNASTTVMQRATGVSSSPGANAYARTVYYRTRNGGTWNPWTRVDVNAHEAAADPHPQYATDADLTQYLRNDKLPVLARNYATNPGFQLDTLDGNTARDGWANVSSPVTFVPGAGLEGGRVAEMTGTVTTARAEAYLTLAPGTYTARLDYMLTAKDAALPPSSAFGQVTLITPNATTLVNNPSLTTSNAPIGERLTASMTFTVPADNTGRVRFRYYHGGHTVRYDRLIVTDGDGSTVGYFDGSQLGSRWTNGLGSPSELILNGPGYIDQRANVRVVAHEAAADPHTQYAKKAGGNTLTGMQVIDANGPLRFLDSTRPVDLRRWDMFYTTTGNLELYSRNDDASNPIRALLLYRNGNVQLGPVIHMSGVGSPEGVQQAGVGSRYVDTAATNGAVEWVKTSGTGTTGWRVVYGDTGWRALNTGLLNGWVAPNSNAAIRRTNDRVTIRVRDLDGTNGIATVFYNAPAGFRPSVATGGVVSGDASSSGGDFRLLSVQALGDCIMSGTPSTFIGGWSEMGYAVDPASTWPTVLP